MTSTKSKKRQSLQSVEPAKTDKTKESGSGRFLARDAKSGRVKSTVGDGRDPMPPIDRGRVIKASIDSAGRILVPAKLRKALDIEPGDDVNMVLKGDVLEIRSLDDAINEAQALVRKYVPKKKSLVDELIAERRAEAGRE